MIREKIDKLWKKHKDIFLYLFFGVLTTLVNWIVYFFLTRATPLPLIASNVIAWAASVAFAYVTNRVFVFGSTAKGWQEILKELGAFVGSRIVSGILDTVLLVTMVDWCGINDMLSKVVIGVIVVVLNYIFSKLLVFRKKG